MSISFEYFPTRSGSDFSAFCSAFATLITAYLDTIGYPKFAFINFPRPRYGHDTSNIVESVNSAWGEIRNLPPLRLLDKIYRWMTRQFFERPRVRVSPGNETLTNIAFKSYQYRAENARQFRVEPSTEMLFLVETPRGHERIVTLPEDNNGRMVNFWGGRCSCRLYQEYAAPCSHALAAIKSIGKEPFNYFPWWSKRSTQINCTYKVPFPPVTITDLKADPNIKPPRRVIKSGRPRVQRIRNGPQEKREKRRCGTCYQYGHYKNTCTNQPIEKHGRRQRGRDRLVIDDSAEQSIDGMSGWDEETEPDDNDEAEDTLPESLPPDLGSDLTHSEYDSNDDSSSDSNDEARPNPHGDSQFAAIVEHKRKKRALKSQNVLYKKQATSSSQGKEHLKSKSSKQKATPKVASNARVNTKKITKRNKNKGKQVATRATRADFTEEDHALLTEKYESIDAVPDEFKDAVWRQLSEKVGLTQTL